MKSMRFLLTGMLVLASLTCLAERLQTSGHWRVHRSVENVFPIQIFLEESSKELILEFQQTVGTVEVSLVCDSGETVYANKVETNRGMSFVIPLENVPEGEYTIYISQGVNEIRGEFVWNNFLNNNYD